MLLILGLVLFIGLVLVHEWGHYIVARRNGVEVEEFGLFFPPRAKVLTKKNGTEYTLNWLPLGGFVKLKGEHDADTRPGTFGAASTLAKAKIMMAGVAMNLVAAFLLLTILALVGMPQIVDNQFAIKSDTTITKQATTKITVDSVVKDSPAAKADLQKNDQIIAIGPENNLEKVADVAVLQSVSKKYAGQNVDIKYVRNGKTGQVEIVLNSTQVVEASKKSGEQKGYIGVGLAEETKGITEQRSTWSAPIVAAGTMAQFTVLTFQGLGHALAGLGSTIAGLVTNNDAARQAGQTEASRQVSGPVGIFVVLKNGTELGYQFVLFVIAIISLSLAIMNALPIPALDGGRLFVMLVSRAIKKPLTKELEEAIHGAGFMLLIGLIILITVVDVKRFF